MTHRGRLSAWGSIVVLASLCACSQISSNSWMVAPIEFDNASDGERESRIDVTYSMVNLTHDTAGGLWTESSGSWLHLDENGDTLRRFNDEMFMTVHGISAVSPAVLAVSRTDRTNPSGGGSGLFLYDTDAETWTKVDVDASTIGDVVSAVDGRLIFVDFLGQLAPGSLGIPPIPGDARPFAIRTVDEGGIEATVLGAESGMSAAAVAVDTDSAGRIYVSTERATFSIDVDGNRSPMSTHSAGTPLLAVSSDGNVLARDSTSADDSDRNTDWAMVRGSSAAREVMTEKGDCSQSGDRGLSILKAGQWTYLPFSCNTNGAAWLNDTTFVLSIGDEIGTILTKVTPPANADGR